MPRVGYNLGFEELNANQTANEVFANLQKGDKVAIVSRFANDDTVLPYVNALQSRGIQARVITGQDGTQDFCFLMNAQKEMVGSAMSTYFLWAALLSNCTSVRAYSVDSPVRRKKRSRDVGGQQLPFDYYNFTNPAIASRFTFEMYKAADT